MRFAPALAALALLAGCGSQAEPIAQAPHGALTATSIGDAEVGMTRSEVEGAVGRPARTQRVSLGLGPVRELDWVWSRGGRDTRLMFDTRSGRLTGFCTEDPRLATADGVRPGGVTLGMLRRSYGDRLDRSPLGPGGPVPANYLLRSGRAALTFAVGQNSEVAAICGGLPRPAGD
jgi:hypothetical protein